MTVGKPSSGRYLFVFHKHTDVYIHAVTETQINGEAGAELTESCDCGTVPDVWLCFWCSIHLFVSHRMGTFIGRRVIK